MDQCNAVTCRKPPATTPSLEVRGGFLAKRALFADERHIRSDLQLVRRAIRQGWAMTAEDRLWVWSKGEEFSLHPNQRIANAAASMLAEFQRP